MQNITSINLLHQDRTEALATPKRKVIHAKTRAPTPLGDLAAP
jgi:hypothetical protein